MLQVDIKESKNDVLKVVTATQMVEESEDEDDEQAARNYNDLEDE